jgi:26S proteasome regulatory subunit T5
MNVHPDVNFEELARSTDDFNGAQLKAVCVEAGMLALRRDATEVYFLADSWLWFERLRIEFNNYTFRHLIIFHIT